MGGYEHRPPGARATSIVAGTIRVRATPRHDLDLHLLAQAVVMIGDDLRQQQPDREQPSHPLANRPPAAMEEDP